MFQVGEKLFYVTMGGEIIEYTVQEVRVWTKQRGATYVVKCDEKVDDSYKDGEAYGQAQFHTTDTDIYKTRAEAEAALQA